MDLCPRGKLDRCLCKDNTKITWPFSPFDMLTCGVKKVLIHFLASQTTLLIFYVMLFCFQCKCKNDNKPKTLTRLGCANGGIPRCPGFTNAVCKDGTIVDTTYVFKDYIKHGTTGCVCPDGLIFK